MNDYTDEVKGLQKFTPSFYWNIDIYCYFLLILYLIMGKHGCCGYNVFQR